MSTIGLNPTISGFIATLEWHIQQCENVILKTEGELSAYKHMLWSAEYLLSEEEKTARGTKNAKKMKAKAVGLKVAQAKKKAQAEATRTGNHSFGV